MNDKKFEELYPFKSNYLELDGLKLHYLDEGNGDPIIMLHGNPTWSFYYRNLIISLRKDYRTIVPDHIGCGFSSKPQKYNYNLEQHISNLELLLEKLKLKNVTLVLHDWGGAIGMGWATRNPELVKKFVVFNTAAFLLPYIPFRINICRTPVLGDILVRCLNCFAGLAVYMACKKNPMPAEVKEGYLKPYNSFANRIAVSEFVKDIPMTSSDKSYSAMQSIENNLEKFKELPMLIIWGEKDFCFNNRFLKRWKFYFPNAEIKKIPDAGHYVVEDSWEEIVPIMKAFLS